MGIGAWLQSLGLEQYEALFRENDIDAEVLSDLTDADLEKLGMTLGHRKRLIRAIAGLASNLAPSPPAAAPARSSPPQPTPGADAERRQLTVMFCDLVGSTALAARLDPEDMREIIGAYHHCCADLITKAGGFVAKYMGDGVLVYFGYPQAHEHDAERALQAGLALVEAVGRLNTAAGVPLQVRVGIATGLVVVGDLIGAGAAQEQAVVGETPNLAARLQALAEPNTVVIAEGTRRLLGDLFELRDLGPKDLKGIAGPVRAWAALRASSMASRFDALHTAGLTALVGREEEFERLLRCWSRTKTGQGQVVLVSGEAGIGKSRLTAALLERLASERTDGIPLFVEEMTKAVLEAGSEGAARHTVSAVPSPALAVPASLHASLMARLDRLGPAKEAAQIGSAIGREFSHALLAAVALKPEGELASALDRLVQAGLLFLQGAPPLASYLFKHALVQDAAYGTLLREPRRALHARIAQALESQFAETAESLPEVLARHFAEAGNVEKAAVLWGKAGQRSAQRSALVEAAEQLKRALNLIKSLPGTPALRREEIKLQVELITPLIHVRGYAAPETRGAEERAHLLIEGAQALGEAPEDPLLLCSALYGSWAANIVAFNGDVMRELAVEFLALAEKQSATGPPMIGHRLMGLSLLHTGEIAGGRAHLDSAIAFYDPAEHRHLAMRFGQDVGASALAWRSLALLLLGYPQDALADAVRALKIARESRHSGTLIYVLNFSVFQHVYCGHFAAANALIDEFDILKDQIRSVFWGGWGTVQRGCVLALTGKVTEAVQNIASGIAEMRSTGTTLWMPLFLSHLALANAEAGQLDLAWANIHEAMTTLETTKENWYEAEINRVAGTIVLLGAEPDAVKAEAYFASALEIARKQEAKSWELRAAMSLARLWRDQGKREQARDLLAPVYGWFTDGFDTPDLREAKSLLAGLVS